MQFCIYLYRIMPVHHVSGVIGQIGNFSGLVTAIVSIKWLKITLHCTRTILHMLVHNVNCIQCAFGECAVGK